MGGGRKKKTLHLKEMGETSSTTNCSAPARNLRKSDLGAVIFVCNHSTIKECRSELLFGLPAPHFAYVKNIRAGLSLFLFNCSDRKLHGIYEATSQGQMNINPYGWTDDHAYNTPYPAQVKVEVRMQCSPLSEEEFKQLIVENYHGARFFYFELDHTQTKRLISKFASRPSVPRPLNRDKRKTTLATSKMGQRNDASGVQVARNAFALLDDIDVECGGSEEAFGSVGTEIFDLHPKSASECSYSAIVSGKDTSLPERESYPSTEGKWTSLFKSSTTSSTKKKDEEPVPKVSDIDFHDSGKEWTSSSDVPFQNGEIFSFELQNSVWASGNNDTDNQSIQAQNLEWASGSYDGENQSFEAQNSEWAIGNYDAQNQYVEAPTSDWGTGNYKSGWQVPAFITSCEAPIGAYEGKDNNLAWLGDDVEWGHPLDMAFPSCQPSCEAPIGSDKGKDSDGPHAYDGGVGASDVTIDQDEDGQPEPFADNGVNEACEKTLHARTDSEQEIDSSNNHWEENVDPSEVAVANIPSPDVQALIVKLMKEVEELKVSHQIISGLQRELVESKAEIQLLKNRCHILESGSAIADLASLDVQALLFKLIEEVEELKVSNQMISALKQELVESKAEIQLLKTRCHILESRLLPSTEDVNLAMIECLNEPGPVINDFILIVGGFDGSMWLPDLCSYLPFEDIIRPLAPMSVIRKYSSAIATNGKLYVLGGENGDMWHDTVESYNPVTDQWLSHAHLNQKKGSLAGASLFGKIFAIGGGNGEECFSTVEMLDLDIGTWIPTRSMLHKRFAPAAAELNGAIYVVGGYDGNSYLSSAERFDPREHSWTSLRSMGTRRSCHSLAVLNDKLYALGGYNGAETVSTTEIFDPRMGSWMTGASMNSPRQYFGTVVLGQKIHVIGGITQSDEIHDTIEVYEEGHSWEMTDLKAVGKRCFFSAVNL